MATRIRKLTAVGLPAREELLVRSLLKMVSARTTETWIFHESLEANVALCNPESALASMVLRRCASHGLLCVSVVHEDTSALPQTLTLRSPIRSGDFIDLLNQASEQLMQPGRPRRATGAEGMPEESLAVALQRLMAQGARHYAAVSVGGVTAVLSFGTQRIACTTALDDRALLALGQDIPAHWLELDDEQGARAFASTAWSDGMDRLLWLVGLHARESGMQPAMDGLYLLRRWPDAGRLPLEPHHLRMASVLVRKPMRAAALAELTRRPLADAHAFLHACALTGLLHEKPSHGEGEPDPAVLAPAPRRSRYGELFQSIRTVLGIRS